MGSEFARARENLKIKLKQNADKTVNEVLNADLKGLAEIGLFGSLVRNDFNCRSDSDIYLLFHDNIPDRQTKGYLRSVAEEKNCDLVFLTKSDFYGDTGNLLSESILKNRMVIWREDADDS
ncbi:MAG: nucleotidyltransferase domain-containing protein [Clostridiales bacterium]|nr:nucleotidyltransferase domain-containing protein [Clostridiales bacterium]